MDLYPLRQTGSACARNHLRLRAPSRYWARSSQALATVIGTIPRRKAVGSIRTPHARHLLRHPRAAITGSRHQGSNARYQDTGRAQSGIERHHANLGQGDFLKAIPGTPSGAPSPRQGMGSDRECAGSPALPAPLDRNHSSSFLSAPSAPDPLFEVEHLGLGAEPEPQQKLWREQRHIMAGCTIDLHEVALPEVVDPRGVEGKHFAPSVPGLFYQSARAQSRQWPSRRPPGTVGSEEPYSSGTPALRRPTKYVASYKARIFGTPKYWAACKRAMLENRSSRVSLRASASSAAARSLSPFRA
jgi:hypothetical protein